jgi:TRAP-type C4-dicarboxylate transport system permease small subunit
MSLAKIVSWLDKITRSPSIIFHQIGGYFLAGMMILTAVDVLLRNTINKPIVGTLDFTEFMMAVMVTSGLAYVALLKDNINADVLIAHLSRRAKIVLNMFTDIISLAIVALMMWQSFMNMTATQGFGLAASITKIPIFPFMGIVGLGFALLTLVLIRNFLELFLEVRK